MGDMADDDEALFSERFNRRIAGSFPHRQRFATILGQKKIWSMWDRDESRFVEIKIRKMRRKHARNAAAWMVRNAKQVTEIAVPNKLLLNLMFARGEIGPKELVESLPVYKALVKRGEKPEQTPKPPELTLDEWAQIGLTFNTDTSIVSNDAIRLRNKVNAYLDACS